MPDDPTLVGRVLAGDPYAFRALVDRHAPALFAWLRWWTADAGCREDVAQEAFLTAWQRLASFDPDRGSFRGWLFTIGRNQAVDAARRRRPLPVADLPESAEDSCPSQEEVFALLDRALAALPVAQRTAFLLSEVHELDLGEVARIEGVPLGTVKSRLSRAREGLRRAMLQPKRVSP